MQKSKLLTRCFTFILLTGFLLAPFWTSPANAAESSTKSNTVHIEKVAPNTKYATNLYVIKSGQPGPVVMVVGGVHGDETAGYTAASKVTSYKIKRGTLLVLPRANRPAINAHKRALASLGNLNREFPEKRSEAADTYLASAILKVMKNYQVDWVMDMHEGVTYSKVKSSDSVGQSVIYYPSAQMTPLAKKIVNTLNKNIKTSYKKFSLYDYPVKGSLAYSAGRTLGANSFIMETSMKDPLSTRVRNQLKAFNMLLDKLNM